MNNKDIIIFGAVIITSLLLMGYVASHTNSQQTPADQKFQVVDTYKGCDVVQYNNQMDAKYHYFLHCK